jgi:hypothetical protein
MTTSGIFRGDRFKLTLCRGDSLSIKVKRWVNSGGACGVVVKGEPTSLAGYTLSASAIALGTERVVPIMVALSYVGSATVPASFTLQASDGDLAFAFAEGAIQVIDVRVQANRVNQTFTILKGSIRMKDSASRAGL